MTRISQWASVGLMATCIICWVEAASIRPSEPRYLTTFANWPEDAPYNRRSTTPNPLNRTTEVRFTARPRDYAYNEEHYQRILDILYRGSLHESNNRVKFDPRDFVDDNTPLEEILARIGIRNPTKAGISTEAPVRSINGDTTTTGLEESSSDDCPICLEHLEETSYKLLCGHKFHWLCLKKWVDQSSKFGYHGHFRSNCPMCRQGFMFKKY